MAKNSVTTFKDRTFTPAEIDLIRELVSDCSGLSRQELANTVCELLGWRRPNGGLKLWECKELLARLESTGVMDLPPLQRTKPRGSHTAVAQTRSGEPGTRLSATLNQVAPVTLHLLRNEEDRRLWRELISRYHYLGHTVPFGAHLRYRIEVARPHPQTVGCLQLSSPAWKMAVRDRWIGWTDAARRRNLQRVVQNSRFLLLPWVEVRNLASAVLGLMARQCPEEWARAYGVQPLLLETLVEEGRYRGTSYRAANWIELGRTRGRGRMDRHHRREGACPKTVFVYPLRPTARQSLREEG